SNITFVLFTIVIAYGRGSFRLRCGVCPVVVFVGTVCAEVIAERTTKKARIDIFLNIDRLFSIKIS
ncbi:MAG TPA: hypothetical protein VF679_04405, partial [Pedobacter sp.]